MAISKIDSDGLNQAGDTILCADSGNVGIGTSSPDGRLHVMTSSAGSVTADADADDLTVEGAANPGISILGTGDDVCSIYFGNPGSNGQKDGGIRYFQESFATVADRRSMTFITGTNERARIDSSGNLLVGTTSASNTKLRVVTPSSTDGCVVELAGNGGTNLGANRTGASGSQFVLYNIYNGSYVGGISMTSTGTSFNTSSDYRLKEDWVAVADASTRVNALKPVNFAWKVDGSRVDGFLAHELADVVPEAVTGEKDAVDAEGNPAYQGIDQSKLVPLLTAALQEALAKIDDLTARVSALEAS